MDPHSPLSSSPPDEQGRIRQPGPIYVAAMVVLAINRVDVDFPFTPYGPQIQYMSKVIDALRNGHNALLESPTGTGKTLCLLCAALAWRSTYIAALQARLHNALSPDLASAAGLDEVVVSAGDALEGLLRPGAGPTGLRAPRIVYASRTHSQLAQAVRELQRTVYRPGMALLASRDQLCVHGISREMSGARLNARCRKITAQSVRGCCFHLPMASPRPDENRSDALVAQLHAAPAMDIEELRSFGEREGACPYYLSRVGATAESCEIMFLPYNYLVDRGIRASLDIDWSNDILIVDEAHNLESVCADAMSFDLTEMTRAGCTAELTKCLTQGMNPMGITIPALEEMAKTKDGLDAVLGTENRDMLEYRIMRSVLTNIEEFVDGVEFDQDGMGDLQYSVFPPERFRKLLDEVNGPSQDTFELFLELLDRAMGASSDADEKKNAEQGNTNNSGGGVGNNPLQTLKSAIRILFETSAAGTANSFRMIVHEDKGAKGFKKGRTLSYWCFDSSIAMKDIEKLGMRCLLLTSGTLSPLSTFASELGLPFPVRLENPHVITKEQVFAGVIEQGPQLGRERPVQLSSAYRSRGVGTQMALGRAIMHIAQVIPDGVLVFFPSYSMMNACITMWKERGPGPTGSKPSLWEHLLRRKLIVVEERQSHELSAAMLAHRANVDTRNGSILFAVCRGKVSEGIDFSDEYGRAVIITGLPYPSFGDPKVKLKRETADLRFRAWQKNGGGMAASSAEGNVKVLSGSEWYTVQAIRAVNQAVGRAIRHKNDYGVVLLCDERFSAKNIQGQVSKWLRPHVNRFQRFDGLEGAVAGFFERARRAPFAAVENSKRSLAANLVKTRADSAARDAGRNAVLMAEKTIARIVPKQLSNEELFARVEALQPAPTQAEEKRTQVSGGVLPWNTSTPVGGSGSMSLSLLGPTAEPEAAPSAPSYSAQFFARRAAKAGPSSGRIQTPIAKTPKRKQAPLSQRAKGVFTSKEDLRQFAAIFRRVIAAEKKINEGAGPLQGKREKMQTMKEGLAATKEFVRYTRGRGDVRTREQFLRDVRDKVPGKFRDVYDALLRSSSIA